jgi:DUF917 family protein
MRLGVEDVPALARGCTVLGSGGGGATGPAELLLRHTLEETGPVPVLDPAAVPPKAVVACVGAVGSSTVMLEKPPSGPEFVRAVRAVEQHTGTVLDAVQTLEIGGVNGLLAVAAAARLGLPLLDSDAMGRAYPRIDQNALLGAVPVAPLALSDPNGNVLLLAQVEDGSVQRVVRALLPALGTWAGVCLHHSTAARHREHAVRGSVSRALALGRALRHSGEDGGAAFVRAAQGEILFDGTVIEVLRSRGAVNRVGGVVSIRHAADRDRSLRLDFADEYVAAFDDGLLVANAPDVIALLDTRTWTPVGVEQIRTQQRVRLLRVPAPPELAVQRPGRIPMGLESYGLAPVATDLR